MHYVDVEDDKGTVASTVLTLGALIENDAEIRETYEITRCDLCSEKAIAYGIYRPPASANDTLSIPSGSVRLYVYGLCLDCLTADENCANRFEAQLLALHAPAPERVS